MNDAAVRAFERAVHEYATWLAVPPDDRSPAPAWWWSSALALREVTEPLPDAWSKAMALPTGASVAAGAKLMLDALAEQTSQPWPDEFPTRYKRYEPADTPT